MENHRPFVSEGVVSLVRDECYSQKVKILRDTGANKSLMLDSVLPLTENSFTRANVLISGVEMGVLEVPLHEVNIKSSLINGNIVIGMRTSLPVEGISMILRNDLAGQKVMVDPRVVEKPRGDEKTEKLAHLRYILCGNTFNEGKQGSHKETREGFLRKKHSCGSFFSKP